MRTAFANLSLCVACKSGLHFPACTVSTSRSNSTVSTPLPHSRWMRLTSGRSSKRSPSYNILHVPRGAILTATIAKKRSRLQGYRSSKRFVWLPNALYAASALPPTTTHYCLTSRNFQRSSSIKRTTEKAPTMRREVRLRSNDKMAGITLADGVCLPPPGYATYEYN